MKHFSAAICTDLKRLQIITVSNNDQQITITYFKFPLLTKFTPTNHYLNILQHHFTSTSTNQEDCHMSNFIHQNEINVANEPLKA